MRKIYALLFFATAGLYAQIPNSDFEAGLGYGGEQVADWGQFFLFPVTIDIETGESHSDVITFGDQVLGMFCSSVQDAHSGDRAMLIRNAFNVTTNTVLPGNVSLFNSEISEMPTGWNTGAPVPADADIQFLSFWYKFAPMGNDVAEASLELFNTNSESIGTAKIKISQPAETYTYASTPLVLSGNGGEPAFIHISFNMAAEGSTPVFGSYLTIDELKVNPGLLQTDTFAQTAFSVWPTVATDEINISKNGNATGSQNFKVANIEGKIVAENLLKLDNGNVETINISGLASGFYILKFDDGFTAKFIKK